MRMKRLAGAVVVSVTLGTILACGAWAQGASRVRIRGSIEAIQASQMTVKERNGQTEIITLDQPTTVTTVKPVALEGIQAGSYIGVTARPSADGSLVALEVHVFPEEMRGAGEGHRPWDLESDSTMTNATVTGVVESSGGSEVTLNYKDGSQRVRVPANAPVVTFAPANVSDLKPGAPVFLTATSKDGSLHAARVTVGTNGVAPPM